jgi:hypothetical protein
MDATLDLTERGSSVRASLAARALEREVGDGSRG